MIKTLSNSVTELYGKQNWIDQNNIVFGYSDSQQCCEEWGWGVYDPTTREKVADSPDGLPYHFDFEHSVQEVSSGSEETLAADGVYGKFEYIDTLDCVQVRLIHDTRNDKKLIFQCYTNHNGYYLHDFSFEKSNIRGQKPRMYIVRGKPGCGKSTHAKLYDCLRLEDDMFAISGGRYHWNDTDGSGIKALNNLHETIEFVCNKKCDFVLASVLPFCSPIPEEIRGYTLYEALFQARKNGYDIYINTLHGDYGNSHGCPASVYDSIFLEYHDLKKQIADVFDEEFANSINWYSMPTEVFVDNEV